MSAAEPQPRTCGSCTFCCKVMTVDELDAPAGVWCRHCTPGEGCGIHQARPNVCRDFHCLWLIDPSVPEALRPDRCQVMMTVKQASPAVLSVHCDPDDPLAWTREPIYGLLKGRSGKPRNGQRITVSVRAGARMWVVAPNKDVDLGEIDPAAPVQFDYQPDGGLRVTVLPPMTNQELDAYMAPLPDQSQKGGKT